MFSNLSGIDIIFVLGSILLSMTLHEAMHAFAAHWLGDTTAQDEGRLSLNPLKHVDLVTTILLPVLLILAHLPPFFAAKPVPFNPDRVKYDEFGAAIVGIAGPLTNLALAVVTCLIIRFGLSTSSPEQLVNALFIFAEVNVSFFVFNMIPFPPLDGSRLLYAFAPAPLQQLMMSIERMGFLSIVVFMLLVFNFIAPLITSISTGILRFLLGA